MKVSDRHKVTRRDAFNYLENTYRAAIEFGQKEASWTTVLHIWPGATHCYVLLEQSGLVSYHVEMWKHIPQMTDFSLPGPSVAATTQRRKVWQALVDDFHYELPICTLALFKSFAEN